MAQLEEKCNSAAWGAWSEAIAEQQRAYKTALIDYGYRRSQEVASSSELSYYHRCIHGIYQNLVPPRASVLEIGSGCGDLLHALRPLRGVGVDISVDLIRVAQAEYPDLEFIVGDAHDIRLQGTFDYIVLSDVALDLWDCQQVFRNLLDYCRPETRIIINSYSRLWEIPLKLARSLGVARPNFGKSWLDNNDIRNLLYMEGYEPIRSMAEILWPVPTPVIGPIFNRYLAKVAPFRFLALANFVIARPAPKAYPADRTVSVIVPARNEAGHIRRIIEEIPDLGAGTEIVFVEGHSTDNTWEVIRNTVAEYPRKHILTMQQTGKGKGDAVRTGFTQSTGEILMILDADLTVPAEDLRRFYDAIQSGRGEFVNGVRLVYAMQGEAMRFLNLCGNKFFALAFTWTLGQPIKDTLCGTKVLTRKAYERIAANRSFFGEFDPFGDFDLIFGAAKQNMKIVDIPIRYQKREYGETNIDRWRDGRLLLKMLLTAASKLKFV